jgi:hypothetical protein
MPYNMQSAFLYAQKNVHCCYHTHKTAQAQKSNGKIGESGKMKNKKAISAEKKKKKNF